jgi:hypothetical protein
LTSSITATSVTEEVVELLVPEVALRGADLLVFQLLDGVPALALRHDAHRALVHGVADFEQFAALVIDGPVARAEVGPVVLQALDRAGERRDLVVEFEAQAGGDFLEQRALNAGNFAALGRDEWRVLNHERGELALGHGLDLGDGFAVFGDGRAAGVSGAARHQEHE